MAKITKSLHHGLPTAAAKEMIAFKIQTRARFASGKYYIGGERGAGRKIKKKSQEGKTAEVGTKPCRRHRYSHLFELDFKARSPVFGLRTPKSPVPGHLGQLNSARQASKPAKRTKKSQQLNKKHFRIQMLALHNKRFLNEAN